MATQHAENIVNHPEGERYTPNFYQKWGQLIQPNRGLLGGLLRLVGPDGCLLDPLQSLQDAGVFFGGSTRVC